MRVNLYVSGLHDVVVGVSYVCGPVCVRVTRCCVKLCLSNMVCQTVS